MKLEETIVLCITAAAHLALGEVWEFGEDAPTSRVVYRNQGDISLFDKTRNILLTAPDCYEIDYVTVEVNNLLSNPSVSYKKMTQTVTIAYKPLQMSMSTYEVVAKAKIKDSCVTQPDSVQFVYT